MGKRTQRVWWNDEAKCAIKRKEVLGVRDDLKKKKKIDYGILQKRKEVG